LEAVPANQCGTQGGAQCVVNTTYSILGPNFGNNPFEATVAQSSYNSLQVSLHHSTSFANFLIGYTYSRCIDNASGLQEGVNPFDPKESLSLCAFNVTNNFVASYEVKVPFDQAFHTSGWVNYFTAGWSVSGITTFATGLPITLSENDDNSLSGTANTEAPFDLPNFTPGGSIYQTTNPRKGGTYFNTNSFSPETIGSFGTSPRRFFHGPGLNNWDMALLKDTKITESKSIQIRFEAFNVWNHAQFGNPTGLINSSLFGVVTAANAPRILQVGAKFIF
jgi:hypothetical protein